MGEEAMTARYESAAKQVATMVAVGIAAFLVTWALSCATPKPCTPRGALALDRASWCEATDGGTK